MGPPFPRPGAQGQGGGWLSQGSSVPQVLSEPQQQQHLTQHFCWWRTVIFYILLCSISVSESAACGRLGSPGKDKTILAHMYGPAYKTCAVSDWPCFPGVVLAGSKTMLYVLGCTKRRVVVRTWKQEGRTAKFIFYSHLSQDLDPDGQSFRNIIEINITYIGNTLCVSYMHWGQRYLTEKVTGCILTLVLPSHGQYLRYLQQQMAMADE